MVPRTSSFINDHCIWTTQAIQDNVATNSTSLNVIQPGPKRETTSPSHFSAGDWVEVRSKEEILQTLDKNGQLEGMPFMPEMFAFCGKRLRVNKRAHKTCDTVHEYKARKMKDAVHLEGIRCDGEFHGGCEASCSIFWKTAWLRTPQQLEIDKPGTAASDNLREPRCSEADVLASCQKNTADPAYVCQATQVPAATEKLGPWEWRQYIEDYSSGKRPVRKNDKEFFFRCLSPRLGQLRNWHRSRPHVAIRQASESLRRRSAVPI